MIRFIDLRLTDRDVALTKAEVLQHVRESKTVYDSGFHAMDSGFRIPGTGFRILSQWNLDSGFQSLEGFQIP